MQSMYIVHGRPGIEGKLVASLLNSSKKYRDPLKYRWVNADDEQIPKADVYSGSPEKTPDYGCIAYATDAKSGEVVEGPKISWRIVKDEGWYAKKGSKWKTMPELMFMYRAASWFANTNCPEVKMGMQTVEEIEDVIDLQQQPNGSYAGDIAEKTKKRIEELKGQLEPGPESVNLAKFEGRDTSESPEPSEAAESHPWARSNWINIRKPGFSTFVHKNLDTFKEIPPEVQAEAINKWNDFYPDDPFPGSIETAGIEPLVYAFRTEPEPDPEPEEEETKEPADDEAEERSRIIAAIKNDFDPKIIFGAKKDLGFPINSYPPTLDGCRVLWKKCRELK